MDRTLGRWVSMQQCNLGSYVAVAVGLHLIMVGRVLPSVTAIDFGAASFLGRVVAGLTALGTVLCIAGLGVLVASSLSLKRLDRRVESSLYARGETAARCVAVPLELTVDVVSRAMSYLVAATLLWCFIAPILAASYPFWYEEPLVLTDMVGFLTVGVLLPLGILAAVRERRRRTRTVQRRLTSGAMPRLSGG